MIYENSEYRLHETDIENEYRLIDKLVGFAFFFNDVKIRDDRIELRTLRPSPGYMSGEIFSPNTLPRGLVAELEHIESATGVSNQ